MIRVFPLWSLSSRSVMARSFVASRDDVASSRKSKKIVDCGIWSCVERAGVEFYCVLFSNNSRFNSRDHRFFQCYGIVGKGYCAKIDVLR